jgi:beta-lactam-binding protein with PASTA domain
VDSVNTGFSGSGRTFQITYTAEAQTGPISVTRQVLVEDTQPPTIEPEAIQHDWQNLLVHGYREYIKDEQGNRYSFHVVNCNANWQNMDGGTALDSCIDDDPIDYWDDVEVTALRLNDNFEPELDGDNQVTLSVEEFTKHPGLYRLEYTVQDAAGNVATYDAPSYLRYVRVMDTTPVPVVAQSGLDQGQAEGRILAAGLIPVVTEEYHHGFNPGVIYSQDPAAGVFVSCGTEVHIVVVVAQALCNFPEGLQGMPLEDAKTALIEAGFLVGEVEYVDSWLDTGLVSHYSGNTEFCGSVIDLFVSAEKCELPLVVEKTPEEAIALIVDNGFAEPSVKYQWHPYPAGMVSGQFPNPGPRQCDFAVEITISMGPEPERIDLAPSLYEDFECGQDWSYLPTATVAGDQGIAAFTQATEIAYKDGEDWIVVALDTPLHTDFSLYRITYRYEFQQPDTDELGVLEVIYDSLNVVDTEPPEIFVDDDSDDGSIEIAENDFPFYILQKGQYGHWSEVEDDRNITVSAFDLCDGDIPEDDIEIWILGLDLATEDSSPLEDLGLTEDTWLNAPGYYLVIYRAEDQTGNEELSFRVVEVQD